MNSPGETTVPAVRPNPRDLGQRYTLCRPVIRRYLAARLRQSALVEDMIQEVFVRALRSRQRCGAQAETPQYLMGIAKNVLREHLRRQKVERRAMAGLSLRRERCVKPPEVAMDAQETDQLLRAAQGRLTPLQREAVDCVWRDGLPPSTVAQRLGCSCKAVCRRLEAARQRLRQTLWRRTELVDTPGYRSPPLVTASQALDD